jgi:hypothetical protein
MSSRLQLIVASFLTFGLLEGCVGHVGGFVPATNGAFAPAFVPEKTPPKCPGQTTTSQFASETVTLLTKGGTFCVPAFGGFGGSITYPPANPSVKLKLILSTTNYNKHLPPLSKGMPLVYLQLANSSGTSFGSNAPAGGGLTGKLIKPSSTYTAFGQASASGITLKLKPCYLVASKGTYGGVIAGIGTLLKGQNVPIPAHGLIEIYAGKQTGTKC